MDKDSQGLIFLTNNGDLVNKILRAGNNHEKEYVVTVNKPLTEMVVNGMMAGVPMLGVTTKKCKIVLETPNKFKVVLVQGLNRQIRRMCEHFGYEVTKLERVRIMNISLKSLPLGDWRDLTENEMRIIYSMIEDSSSDDVKKADSKTTDKKVATRNQTPKEFSKNTRNNPDFRKRNGGGNASKKSGQRKRGRR